MTEITQIKRKPYPHKKLILLATFLIYMSNGIFPQVHLSALYRVLIVIIVSGFTIWTRKKHRILLNKENVYIALVFIVLQSITIILHGFDPNSDFFLILSIVAALLYSSAINEEEFIEGYRWTIKYITIGSIFFYVLGLLIPYYVNRIPSFMLQSTRWDNAYTLLGSFVVRNRTYSTYYRSFGIFSEPGQFQIFLCVGLVIEFFSVGKPNLKNIIILFAGLLTCNSTNGYIVAVLITLAYVFNYDRSLTKQQKRVRNGTIIALFVILVGLIVVESSAIGTIVESTLSKLSGLNTSYTYSERGTALERRRAFDIALEIYLQHPVEGYGYTGMRRYVSNLNSSGFIMTFSPLNWFARYGTVYGILTNLLYVFSFAKEPRKKISRIILVFSLFAMISAQAVTADIFIWVLIFYGFHNLRNGTLLKVQLKKDIHNE